jgi:aminoglycoside phosphotransferase (APT) family kinase protein
MHVLCEDTAVIGSAFYVMQEVEGAISMIRACPNCPSVDRRAIQDGNEPRSGRDP